MIAEKEFPPASLTAAVMKAWGVTSIPDLARAANGISPPDFAGLFPDVAASSDVAAGRILADAGRELAAVAGVVIRGLFGDRDEALRVAVTGGVFRYAEPVREVFYNELRALDSRADVSRLVVDPVEGALQMARRGAAKLS
jgi:N-acetylglucosamine kinase-like BadF-type ATPase